MTEEKLTKKQKKALEFKKKKGKTEGDVKTEEKDGKKETKEENITKSEENTSEKRPLEEGEAGETPKKKRKTRRGKKGKGTGGGPRFILFVGNLPYNTSEESLRNFFKSSKPDVIRIRQDKGIAFMEFLEKSKEESSSFRSRMDLALAKHHAIFEGRKINVELTAGGGGNSKARLEKIKEKNLKVEEERKQKAAKAARENKKKKEKKELDKQSGASTSAEQTSAPGGIHPSRLALIKKK